MSEPEHTLGELRMAIDEKSKYKSTERPMTSEGSKYAPPLSLTPYGNDKVYPPMHTVGLIMFGLYIAMFLVALVGRPNSSQSVTNSQVRIESLYLRQYQRSQITSTQLTT
jgi:hypothetical protein